MGAVALDALMIRLGVCGWFPLGVFCIQSITFVCACFFFLGNSMTTYVPKFWCDNLQVYNDYINENNNNNKSGSGGGIGDTFFVDGADVLANFTEKEICSIGCVGSNGGVVDDGGGVGGQWRFESASTSHSLAAEWLLICDREYLLSMTETFFYLGGLTGCLFIGYLSDTFGRRKVVMAAAFVSAVAGLQVVWIDHFYYYVAIRFFLGMGYIGFVSLMTYRCETFSSRHRFIPMLCDPSWTITAICLPFISYSIPAWRTLCTLMYGAALLIIPAVFFSPESPSWLIRKGRKKEAFDILQRVAKSRGFELEEDDFMNRVAASSTEEEEEEKEGEGEEEEITKMLNDKDDKNDSGEKKNNNNDDDDAVDTSPAVDTRIVSSSFASAAAADDCLPQTMKTTTTTPDEAEAEEEANDPFLRAIKSPRVVLLIFIAGLTWSYANFVYIGITFSYALLPGNRHVNFALIQMTGIPSKFLGIAVCYFVNRRPSIGVGVALIGSGYVFIAACRLAVGGEEDIDDRLPVLRKAVNLMIKTVMSVSWEAYSMWLQEAFPTLIRGRCYMLAMLCGRLASIAASFLSYFQKTNPLAVEATLGVLGLLMVFAVFPIPETQGEPLPQSLRDMRRMREKTRRRGCRLLKASSSSTRIEEEKKKSKTTVI